MSGAGSVRGPGSVDADSIAGRDVHINRQSDDQAIQRAREHGEIDAQIDGIIQAVSRLSEKLERLDGRLIEQSLQATRTADVMESVIVRQMEEVRLLAQAHERILRGNGGLGLVAWSRLNRTALAFLAFLTLMAFVLLIVSQFTVSTQLAQLAQTMQGAIQ